MTTGIRTHDTAVHAAIKLRDVYLTRVFPILAYCYLFFIAGWSKSFAYLPSTYINAPVFVTELLLAATLCAAFLVWKRSTPGELLPKQGPGRWALFVAGAYLSLGLLRFPFDFMEYRLQAARDSATVYYALFFLLFMMLGRLLKLSTAVKVMCAGQITSMVLYAITRHYLQTQAVPAYVMGNDSIFILPLLFGMFALRHDQWGDFWKNLLLILPLAVSQLFRLKRTALLGGVIVFAALAFLAPRTLVFRRAVAYLPLLAVTALVSIGIMNLNAIVAPIQQDLQVLLSRVGLGERTSVGDHDSSPAGTPGKRQISPESPESPLTHFRLLHGEDLRGGSMMEWRMHMWRNALADIREKPFWGWGFGPYVVRSLAWGPDPLTERFMSGPHNAYLTIAFRTGIIGLLLLLGFHALFFIDARDRIHRGASPYLLIGAGTVLYSLIFAFFNIGFESPQHSVPAYVLMGLMMSTMETRQRDRDFTSGAADPQ